jgi:deoxyribose-phosphate aldolase
MKISKEYLTSIIDETLLDPAASEEDVIKVCKNALKYGFASVALLTCNVPIAYKILKGSKVKIDAAVGFPLGLLTPEAKAFEAKDAIENGADEIDMVINISALKSNLLDLVAADITETVKVAHASKQIVKVILEQSLLTEIECKTACQIAEKCGADFVKTSTGFKGFPIRPTSTEDVSFLRQNVSKNAKVKAAGGIRTFEEAVAMINAGAERIGTSSGAKILAGYKSL